MNPHDEPQDPGSTVALLPYDSGAEQARAGTPGASQNRTGERIGRGGDFRGLDREMPLPAGPASHPGPQDHEVPGVHQAEGEALRGLTRETPSLQGLLGEVERFHAWASSTFFGGRLSRNVVISVAPKGQREESCWFVAGRWQATGDPTDRPHEIVLAAEDLHRPPADILHAVFRALLHQANAEAGTPDYHPIRQYHNRFFKRAAEACGLAVARDGRRGWSRTLLTPALRRRILEEFRPDPATFRVYRPAEELEGPPKQAPWACGCSGKVQVARRQFHVRCLDCGELFVRVEPRRRKGKPG